MFITKRIFMSEADSGSGNGASPEPAVSAEPAAAQTAPAFDADALVARFAGVVEERIAASEARVKNATFAELRKGGHLERAKTAEVQPTTSAPNAAQAGLSTADVEIMLERRDVVATLAAQYGLTGAGKKRLESALVGVPRESLPSEGLAYLTDMGVAKASQPAPATQPQSPAATAPAKPNISDRGTAAPTDTRDFEGVLNSRPFEMTWHDVAELTLKHGHDKGMQMFQERVLAALGKVRIKPPRG